MTNDIDRQIDAVINAIDLHMFDRDRAQREIDKLQEKLDELQQKKKRSEQ